MDSRSIWGALFDFVVVEFSIFFLRSDTAVPEGVRGLAEKTLAQTRQAYDNSLDAFDASLTSGCAVEMVGIDPLDLQAVQDQDAGTVSTPLNGAEAGGTHKGSDVVTSTANRSLLHIAELLTQHGIGCIVIVGEDGKIAGIISERDLIRAIGQVGPKVLDRPVSDFMTKNVVTAREDDTSERLMSEMTVHRFSAHARDGDGPADWPHLHR